MAHFSIGLAYARLGRLSEAIEAGQHEAPGFPLALSLLAYTHARANQGDQALERLGELQALATRAMCWHSVSPLPLMVSTTEVGPLNISMPCASIPRSSILSSE